MQYKKREAVLGSIWKIVMTALIVICNGSCLTHAAINLSDVQFINQLAVDGVYNAWNKSSSSDKTYYSAGVWNMSTTPNPQYCSVGPAVAASTLWMMMGSGTPPLLNTQKLLTRDQYYQMAVETMDYQISNYQRTVAGKSFGAFGNDKVNTNPGSDITTIQMINLLGQTYLNLESGLDSAHQTAWKNSLRNAADFLVNNKNLIYYINGNIEIAKTSAFYKVWLILGDSKYLTYYDNSYGFMIDPYNYEIAVFGITDSRWIGAGLKPTLTSSSAFLTEAGVLPWGYDPEYTGTLQLDFAAGLYRLTDDAKYLTLSNQIERQVITNSVNTSTWMLNTNGGTRHNYQNNPPRLVPFTTCAMAILSWLGGRSDIDPILNSQLQKVDSDYRSIFASGAVYQYRGYALEISEFMLAAWKALAEGFTEDFSTYATGASFNGANTRTGQKVWVTGSDVKIGTIGTDRYGAITGNTNKYAGVAIDAPTDVVTLTAKIKPYGISNNWFSMGFQKAINQPPITNNSGQLWLIIRTNGNYSIFANGTIYTLATGAVPAFNATGFNLASIQYIPSTNQVSVQLNGVTVLNNYNLNGLNFTPTINSVVFWMNGSLDTSASNPGFDSVVLD